MGWKEVCKSGSIIDGDATSVEVDGVPVTVCIVGGEYCAFSTICTHEDVSLADGYLEGTEIECPLHGSRFDVRTGKCMNPPATRDLATFATKTENGKLYVDVEE